MLTVKQNENKLVVSNGGEVLLTYHKDGVHTAGEIIAVRLTEMGYSDQEITEALAQVGL